MPGQFGNSLSHRDVIAPSFRNSTGSFLLPGQRGPMRAWCYFLCTNDQQSQNEAIEALLRERIATEPLAPDNSHEPGILFIGQADDRACRLLQDVSCGGLKRVIAVAPSGEALRGGASWMLLRAGASDVFAWDHSRNPASEIHARLRRWQQVDEIVDSPLVREHLVGSSSAWVSVLRQVVEVARFTSASVLILGESGTGKEMIARLIHALDARERKRDLVLLDCTTIVPELSGSEFFGHERGSFTGAVAVRDGAFALADGGTLFLDEVGELPLQLQAELLRVVQEQAYKRIGSNKWQSTQFRLVCATNKDLPAEQKRGRFRNDFYYRIASWVCKLPPLRERTEDILPLARFFIQHIRPDDGLQEMDDAVREYLIRRDYPGNVRELKQLVSRMVYRHVGSGPLTAGDIAAEERPHFEADSMSWYGESFEQVIRRAVAQGVGLKEIGRAAEKAAERIVIREENGNLKRAARRLGVTDRALQMRRATKRES